MRYRVAQRRAAAQSGLTQVLAATANNVESHRPKKDLRR
jgi:hypothetical protein